MGVLNGLSVGALIEWLKGKKTYIMIAVVALDELGATQGWWAADHLREVIELALGGAAARAALK